MAVTVDATATLASSPNTAVTTITNSSLTVGAGATALLAILVTDGFTTNPTSIVVKWDNAGTPQTMTSVASRQSTNSNILLNLYGLVNPTAGNKNLTATWTTGVPAMLDAISFNGTITTSVATAFLHAATNLGTSGSPSQPLTSAVGNIAVACEGSTGTITSLIATGSTSIFNSTFGSSFGNFGCAASWAPGAASITFTGSPTSTEWDTAGVDIVAAPVAVAVAWPRATVSFFR